MDDNPYIATTATPDAPSGTSGMAIASLVLGLASFVLCIFTGIPAILLGIFSLQKINRSAGRLSGRGMAIAGMVLGGVGMCVFVIGLLVALMLPAVGAAREAARRNASVNNMKFIGLAMHNYHMIEDHFPARASFDENGKPLLSWRVHLLPYLEEQALYEQFHLDEPWDSEHNRKLIEQMPEVFASPESDPTTGRTNYVVPTGEGTAFAGEEGLRLDEFTDGMSQTIVLVEVDDAHAVPWTKPEDLPITDRAFQEKIRWRSGGAVAVVLFADGHVEAMESDIAPETLKAMVSPSDGKTVDLLE